MTQAQFNRKLSQLKANIQSGDYVKIYRGVYEDESGTVTYLGGKVSLLLNSFKTVHIPYADLVKR